MKTIIIDMDNVIAQVSAQFISWYQRETGVVINPSTLEGLPEEEGFPQPELIRQFLYTPGFFTDIPVMPDSQKVVADLNKKYHVFIVSAALEFPQSIPEKFGWLQQHFPFIGWKQIAFCGSKSLLKGDVMIDDYPRNLNTFIGDRYLFTAPHNTRVTGYNRVDNWAQIAAIFL